jgi:hypothetical protein
MAYRKSSIVINTLNSLFGNNHPTHSPYLGVGRGGYRIAIGGYDGTTKDV